MLAHNGKLYIVKIKLNMFEKLIYHYSNNYNKLNKFMNQ